MNITLPCALITGFKDFKMDTSMLFIILIGFLANIIMSTIGFTLAKNKDNKEKAFNMLNLAGYNIGCFTLPLCAKFFRSIMELVLQVFLILEIQLCVQVGPMLLLQELQGKVKNKVSEVS